MVNPIFAFKEFSVKQDKCPMKISTDSVLLGAWVKPNKAKRILDIGTGTGVIALMLAQRSQAKIDALDISEDAYLQAKENFSESKWKANLRCYLSSLQDFSLKVKYDIIVSNPPYFFCPVTHQDKEGSQAKYTHKLSFCELVEGVVRLLSPKGKFYVILPIHEGACFTNEAEKKELFLTKFIWVKTTNRKKTPKRILMQFEFKRKAFSDDEVLVIQSDNDYTDEYKALTKDFYLRF